MQGTISFGAGFFFVVIGWPVIGMILEAYGFIVLFRSVGYLSKWFMVICLHPVEDSDRNFPQWFLAYTGSFCAEDTDFWMGVPTAFCEIGMFTLELKIKTFFLDFHPCRYLLFC
jgi:hypothetical protein